MVLESLPRRQLAGLKGDMWAAPTELASLIISIEESYPHRWETRLSQISYRRQQHRVSGGNGREDGAARPVQPSLRSHTASLPPFAQGTAVASQPAPKGRDCRPRVSQRGEGRTPVAGFRPAGPAVLWMDAIQQCQRDTVSYPHGASRVDGQHLPEVAEPADRRRRLAQHGAPGPPRTHTPDPG